MSAAYATRLADLKRIWMTPRSATLLADIPRSNSGCVVHVYSQPLVYVYQLRLEALMKHATRFKNMGAIDRHPKRLTGSKARALRALGGLHLYQDLRAANLAELTGLGISGQLTEHKASDLAGGAQWTGIDIGAATYGRLRTIAAHNSQILLIYREKCRAVTQDAFLPDSVSNLFQPGGATLRSALEWKYLIWQTLRACRGNALDHLLSSTDHGGQS